MSLIRAYLKSIIQTGSPIWHFSIIDVIVALTSTDRSLKYWSDLKSKLQAESSELSEKIGQLKKQSEGSKYYLTDVADTEQIFRSIQSFQTPIVEPFKQWLAKICYTY